MELSFLWQNTINFLSPLNVILKLSLILTFLYLILPRLVQNLLIHSVIFHLSRRHFRFVEFVAPFAYSSSEGELLTSSICQQPSEMLSNIFLLGSCCIIYSGLKS